MAVIRRQTPAAFFPRPHVQQHMDGIDSTVHHAAIEFAQEQFLETARPCPGCGGPPPGLSWLRVTDPEAAWDVGTGRVGFLTVCRRCRPQVDFLVDQELTDMQAELWRECRTLK